MSGAGHRDEFDIAAGVADNECAEPRRDLIHSDAKEVADARITLGTTADDRETLWAVQPSRRPK
jgi:hypothetical protein